jgi:prepilin-type processing-associated H-X9-DG protein
VVIAIIAILAAILFPVFAQAREKARMASCSSNLKQVTMGFMMYAQDNDEILPKYRQSPGVPPNCTTMWYHQTYPYTKNWNVFQCPSVSVSIAYGINLIHTITCSGPALSLASVQRPSEAMILADAAGDGSCTVAPDGVESPGFPCTYCSICSGCAYVAGNGTAISARHNGGANGGFVDGHVKFYRQEKYMSKDVVGNLWGHPY